MTLESDFTLILTTNYVGNKKMIFKNESMEFSYHLYLTYHSYQENGDYTIYYIRAIVDDEYIHPNHKPCIIPEIEHGFIIKSVRKKGEFSEKTMETILNKMLQTNFEKEFLRGRNKQKIQGLLSGDKFYV